MIPRCEGAWWAAQSPGRSVAHWVVMRMDHSLLLGCEHHEELAGMRPKLPTDHMCLPCCERAAKTLPQRPKERGAP